MAAVRRILGYVTVETAKKKRTCYRNRDGHAIAMGDPCLVIRQPSYQGSKNYCRLCAKEILARAKQDLDGLESALFGHVTPGHTGK